LIGFLFSACQALLDVPAAAPIVLLLLGVAAIVLFVIDDDDLPGPRLCRVAAR
jgi:hypothetical protein